jgi:hypothetical protein
MGKGMQDPALRKANLLFVKSGRSLDELGLAMGYPKTTARQSVWQFLSKTTDPRLSMLRRFAKAMRIDVKDLL